MMVSNMSVWCHLPKSDVTFTVFNVLLSFGCSPLPDLDGGSLPVATESPLQKYRNVKRFQKKKRRTPYLFAVLFAVHFTFAANILANWLQAETMMMMMTRIIITNKNIIYNRS